MNTLKYILIFTSFLLFINCSSDATVDCFQKAGTIVRDEVSVDDFTKITVFENVSLVLKEGPVTKVTVETGSNLRNEVSVAVVDGRLLLRDTNDCNYVREYGVTKVYVTAPDISEIRSSTGLKIESDGVLTYPKLNLISESFNNSESETTDGEFELQVASEQLTIVVNGIAYFKLRGTVDLFGVTIAAGDSRVEAEDLIANTVQVNHRGSNDIFCFPKEEILGEIRSIGDVIGFYKPPVIEVDELFKGRLIFND